MTTKLSSTEIDFLENLLLNYQPAQLALSTLKSSEGDLYSSFNVIWEETISSPGVYNKDSKSFWEITLKVVNNEICGDESFRSKIINYNNDPSSVPLLTGAIVYLANHTSLPLNPTLATIIVLYIVKIGINIFCEYTAT